MNKLMNEFLMSTNFMHTLHFRYGNRGPQCAMGLKQLPILKSCLIQYTLSVQQFCFCVLNIIENKIDSKW